MKKKKRPKLKQGEVYDENGIRRFHGAFSGGFSAGYFNSVKNNDNEEWKPKKWYSSKDKKKYNINDNNNLMKNNDEQYLSTSRREDFMDKDDGLLGMKIIPIKLKNINNDIIQLPENRINLYGIGYKPSYNDNIKENNTIYINNNNNNDNNIININNNNNNQNRMKFGIYDDNIEEYSNEIIDDIDDIDNNYNNLNNNIINDIKNKSIELENKYKIKKKYNNNNNNNNNDNAIDGFVFSKNLYKKKIYARPKIPKNFNPYNHFSDEILKKDNNQLLNRCPWLSLVKKKSFDNNNNDNNDNNLKTDNQKKKYILSLSDKFVKSNEVINNNSFNNTGLLSFESLKKENEIKSNSDNMINKKENIIYEPIRNIKTWVPHKLLTRRLKVNVNVNNNNNNNNNNNKNNNKMKK